MLTSPFTMLLLLTAVPSAVAGTRAFFVFGDSLVDSGNNNFLETTARADYPPYGIDLLPSRRPTGRFSDGLNLPDILCTNPSLPFFPLFFFWGDCMQLKILLGLVFRFQVNHWVYRLRYRIWIRRSIPETNYFLVPTLLLPELAFSTTLDFNSYVSIFPCNLSPTVNMVHKFLDFLLCFCSWIS